MEIVSDLNLTSGYPEASLNEFNVKGIISLKVFGDS